MQNIHITKAPTNTNEHLYTIHIGDNHGFEVYKDFEDTTDRLWMSANIAPADLGEVIQGKISAEQQIESLKSDCEHLLAFSSAIKHLSDNGAVIEIINDFYWSEGDLNIQVYLKSEHELFKGL